MIWQTRRRWLFALLLMILFCLLLFSAPLVAAAAEKAQPAYKPWSMHMWSVRVSKAVLILIATFAIAVGGLAIQLWARITFPQRTEAILRALDGKRWKLFLVGLVNVMFLLLFFYGFAQVVWLQWLAMLVGMFLLAIVFLGLLAKAERLGATILEQAGRTPNPVTSVLVGWPVLYFVVIIPLLGQAVLLYLILSGAGAVVLSFMGSASARAGEPPEDREQA